MPKIQGSLADVSTERTLIQPDTYEMKVISVDVEETKPTSERPSGQLRYTVVSAVDQPDSEFNGRRVYDNIYWYKKDGSENEYSKIQLKRYFEAVLGEEDANRDDLDTDELKGGRFVAQIYIDTYEGKDGTEGQTNRLKNIVPLD